MMLQPIFLNLLSIPATAYIIRGLGALGYGQWMVGVSLVAAMTFLTNLGLRTLFVRDLAQRPEQAQARLAEQLGLRTVLAVAAGIIAWCLCLLLHYPPVVLHCVALAAAGLVMTAAVTGLNDLVQSVQHLSALATTNLISGLVLTAGSVLAIWYGAGPVGLSAAYLTGPAVNLVLLLAYINRRLFPVSASWSVGRSRILLHEVRAIGWQQLFSSVQDRIQQLLVPKIVGIAAFGYFSAGLIPASRLEVVPDGLLMYYYSRIARSCREDHEAATRQIVEFMVISLATCLPLAILMSFFAPPIAHLLFPKHAAVCRDVIRLTVWSLPLAALTQPLLCALQACGRHAEASRSLMKATVLSSVLSLLLIRHFGLNGACWSWLIGYTSSVVFLLPPFVRAFPSVLPRVPFLRVLSCAGVMSLLVGSASLFHQPPPMIFVAVAVFSLFCYGGGLFALRVIGAASFSDVVKRG